MNINFTGPCHDLGQKLYRPCTQGIDFARNELCSSELPIVKNIVIGFSCFYLLAAIIKIATAVFSRKRRDLYVPLENMTEEKVVRAPRKMGFIKTIGKSFNVISLIVTGVFFVAIAYFVQKISLKMDQCNQYTSNYNVCQTVGNYTATACEGFVKGLVDSIRLKK